ncbi:MAG: hypothetical protein HYX79_02340 [Chloroflexi bacterium]|nr:hypothetical protein [Chloroflexota bacterium]
MKIASPPCEYVIPAKAGIQVHRYVIPAKAGIQSHHYVIPAKAGIQGWGWMLSEFRLSLAFADLPAAQGCGRRKL